MRLLRSVLIVVVLSIISWVSYTEYYVAFRDPYPHYPSGIILYMLILTIFLISYYFFNFIVCRNEKILSNYFRPTWPKRPRALLVLALTPIGNFFTIPVPFFLTCLLMVLSLFESGLKAINAFVFSAHFVVFCTAIVGAYIFECIAMDQGWKRMSYAGRLIIYLLGMYLFASVLTGMSYI